MTATKRDFLFALAALAAGATTPALAQGAEMIDLSAGRAIGAAYLAEAPSVSVRALRADLLPNGFSAEAMALLRARVAGDFHARRVFVYRGWRLSETEARLFALLT